MHATPLTATRRHCRVVSRRTVRSGSRSSGRPATSVASWSACWPAIRPSRSSASSAATGRRADRPIATPPRAHRTCASTRPSRMRTRSSSPCPTAAAAVVPGLVAAGRDGHRPGAGLPPARPGRLPALVPLRPPRAGPAGGRGLRPAGAASAPSSARGRRRPPGRSSAPPGCYPTATILALAPLARAGLIGDLVVDAKSGVSGAGREPKPDLIFGEVNESVKAYGLGGHRHVAEIEQELAAVGAARRPAGAEPGRAAVDFLPHLDPDDARHPRRPATSGRRGPSTRPSSTRCTPPPTPTSRSSRWSPTPPATKHVIGSNTRRIYVRRRAADRPDPRPRRHRQPGQGRRRPGDPGVQRRLRPARDGRARAAPARAVTAADRSDPSTRPAAALAPPTCRRPCPPALPTVDATRRAAGRLPRPAGAAAGIKAVGPARPGRRSRRDRRRGPRPRPPSSPATAFAAAPVRLSQRAPRRRPTPAGGGRLRLGRRVVIARAAAPTRPPAPPATPTRREVAAAARRGRSASQPERTLALSTGVIGTRLPARPGRAPGSPGSCRRARRRPTTALEAAAVALRTTDSTDQDRPPTTVELPGAGRHAGRRSASSGIAKGVGHDPSPDGHDAGRRPDRRDASTRRRCTGLLRPAAARTWNQLTVDGDTSTNDTVFLLASGRRRRGRRSRPARRGRARSAARSRPSPATWPASRPPTARARRRSSPARSAAPPTTPTPGPSPVRSSAAAWSRRRSTAATRTGAGSPAPPATPAWPTRRPRGGRPAPRRGRARGPAAGRARPGPAPDRDRRHARLRRPAAARCPSTARPPGRRWTRPEVLIRLDLGLGDGTGEAFGCDLTEEYVRENAEYTT